MHPCLIDFVLQKHYFLFLKVVGFIHVVEGLEDVEAGWLFDVIFIVEFLLQLIKLGEVCADVIVYLPRHLCVLEFLFLLMVGEGKPLSFQMLRSCRVQPNW